MVDTARGNGGISTSRGHTAHRLWMVMVAVTLLMLVPIAQAVAGDQPTVRRQAWGTDSALVTFVPEDGHLYVSSRVGMPDAQVGVELEGGDDPTRALIGSQLELTEADDGLLPDQAEVVACALETPLAREGRVDRPPEADCQLQVPLTRSDEGKWSVPLDPFLERWRTAPVGVVLVARPSDDVATWRVAFDASGTVLRFPVRGSHPSPTEPRPTPSDEPDPSSTGSADLGETDDIAAGPVADRTQPLTPTSSVPRVSQSSAAPSLSEPTAPTAQASGPVADRLSFPDADRPASLPVLVAAALGLVTLFALARKWGTVDASPAVADATAGAPVRATAAKAGLLALVMLAPLAASDVTLFRVGLVLITMIGAMGLHVLVNWTGELSLAHAGLIGLPAFTVAKLSGDLGWSPLLLLPVATLIGAVVGGVIGLPALRSRGLQVAVVTLAAGLAIERFFFSKPWLVGASGGVDVAEATLGPLSFSTTRSLYPLIALAFLATVGGMSVLYRSKIVRAWLWIRNDPDAASVFGVPVAAYRVLAYCVAGAIAGFAGGLSGVWVQRLTPGTFPVSLSFMYLVIVVVGGRGFVGGVLAAAALVEGGRLFFAGADVLVDYGGPIALIIVLTRYRTGLNGIGRQTMTTIQDRFLRARPDNSGRAGLYTVQFCLGVTSVVLGFVAISLAWYHAGNTDQVWIQNQELISGGFGGLAAVLLGAGVLIRDQIAKAQARLTADLEALLDQRALHNEFSTLQAGDTHCDDQNGAAPGRRRARQLEATR